MLIEAWRASPGSVSRIIRYEAIKAAWVLQPTCRSRANRPAGWARQSLSPGSLHNYPQLCRTTAQRSSVHLRPVLPRPLLLDSVGEFGQYPGNGLKTQKAPVDCWRSSLLFVLQLLPDEPEIRLVLGTVIQPDIELAAGAGPVFADPPHINIGIRRGVVGETA